MGSLQTNTLIIGASAAGLAVAACLQKQVIPFLLLEKEALVGHSWRNHYDRLHLHTDRGNSQLPYLPMPKSYPKYPSRDQVVAYLEAYVDHFNLTPQFHQEVQSVSRENGRWRTQTQNKIYHSENVAFATGYTRVPNIPTWSEQEKFTGSILHSAAYKNGRSYAGKNVLVVGFGNSAGEIAIDLTEHHAATVVMSVRSPVNVIPKEFLKIPALSIGIVMDLLPPKLADLLAYPLIALSIGDLTKYGLNKLPYGPNVQIRQDGQIPILDIGTVKLIKNGQIQIAPDIERFTETGVQFEDGSERPFDAVILGTGYKPRLDQFIQEKGVLQPNDTPTTNGVMLADGLYACGFYVSPTGMLREIGIEAKKISEAIATKSASNGQ